MSDQNLSKLGVQVEEVSRVEDIVLAQAEANAKQAEAHEFQSNLEKLDNQLQKLRTEELKLSKSSFTVQRSRELDLLKKKICSVVDKKKALQEANSARREIRQREKTLGESVADDQRAKDESERDFLIRTGKLTPFEGQQGYERRQNKSGPIARRKVNELRVVSPDGLRRSRKNITDGDGTDECQVSANDSLVHSKDSEKSRAIQKSPKRKSVRNVRKTSDGEDDYVPEESSDESNYSDLKPEKKNSKRRRSFSFGDAIDDIDEEEVLNTARNESDDDLFLAEGDDWAMDDEEEFEFDGGLKIPSSIYDKLFDYQKIGVS